MSVVFGSPVTAFVDALTARLLADTALAGLVSIRIYGRVPEAARATFPYVQLGNRTRDNSSGTMGKPGGLLTVQLDCWGGVGTNKGPYEVQNILSQIARVLERQTLNVSGYAMVANSLTCEFEDVFEEPDADAPEQRLYHGLQRWVAEVHES